MFTFILCDHGYGHTRRGLEVARHLQRLLPSASIRILANRARADRFGVEVEHFATKTEISALESGAIETCCWEERLPQINPDDLIISDNLPEVLNRYPNAILMGSFLWHQALPTISEDYRQRAEDIFQRHKPTMIGTGYFATPELKHATHFLDCGLFAREEITLHKARPKRKGVLVTCGGSSVLEGPYQQLLLMLAGAPALTQFNTIYGEPRLLPDTRPPWMVAADFSPEMYWNLKYAIVRPGLGTVTDLLSCQVEMGLLFESENLEMLANAQALETRGLANRLNDIDHAFAAITEYQKRSVALPWASLEFEGAASAARILATLAQSENA